MCKKILCFALCGFLIASMAVTAFAQPEEKSLTISTVEEFLAFAENCRLDTYSDGLIVLLAADLDLTGVEFAPIPLFGGTFMGDGHTISGVEITANGSEQGFFRKLSQSAYVSDLHIQGKVIPGGSRSKVGGVAGYNAGTVTDCSFTGTVSGRDQVGGIVGCNDVTGIVQRCFTEGAVSGNHFVGGIAGSNAGVVRLCGNNAKVNTEADQNSVDISDITVGTITGTEAAITVTDVGGVAGISSGVIRNCKNHAAVGYPYMGYNIGGIAGSITGYLTECENYGTVNGRKEVGGIAGQMEPAVLLEYDTDTFGILRGQLATLSQKTDAAAANAQSNTSVIKNHITNLQTHTENAEKALDSLSGVEDMDSVLAIVQTLSGSMTGIDNSIRGISQAAKDTGTQLEKDLQAVADQAKNIEATLSGAGENLGGTVADVSDSDTEADVTGKVSVSVNSGTVTGDWNVGGIAGAMAIENDFDPEQDVEISGSMSFYAAGKLRSVIHSCENRGAISARKKNVGGIVGWQSMGLVKNAVGNGKIDAPSADYVGGIAGQSAGYIRNCSAKRAVAGSNYVGGIAGSGSVVTDCRSMAVLTGKECVGGILGMQAQSNTEQPVLGNLYAFNEKDPGGIDGISYSGAAESTDYETFLADENVPSHFREITVTYQFSQQLEQLVFVPAGSLLKDLEIPEIPSQNGQLGRWEGLKEIQDTPLYWDVTLQAVYAGHGNTIATEETRENKPLMLLQGDFSAGSVLTVTPMTGISAPEEDFVLLDAAEFTVTESNAVTTARYLLPGTEKDALCVYVRSADGSWQPAAHTLDGSYIVFPVCQQDSGFAVWVVPYDFTPWFVGGAIAVVLLAGLAVFLICRRKKSVKA